jgi:hypothetical protein
MTIEYFAPLSKALEWMKSALFRPFDIRTWFVVGFTAFLAELGEMGGNVPNFSSSWRDRSFADKWERFPELVSDWISEHPQLVIVILFAIALALVLGIALLWVSSRGKFMFLDNVVHRRAQVSAPWSEFENQGNSLFLWSLAFGLVSVLILLPYIVLSFLHLRDLYEMSDTVGEFLLPLIGLLSGFGVLMLIVSFISMLLTDFVVPIMYRERIRTVAAWGVFMPLLKAHALSFILYGVLKFFLVVTIAVALALVGCATCCIGFLILFLPYLGSVVRLPISYTFRAYGVSFLEQFGEQYRIFPLPAAEIDPNAPPSF